MNMFQLQKLTGIGGMGLCVWHWILTKAKISPCTLDRADLLPSTLSM